MPYFNFKTAVVVGMLLFYISPEIANAETLCKNPYGKIIKKLCLSDFHGEMSLLSFDHLESLIYEFALFSTKKSSGLKESQRQWIKKRDACRDMNCAIESTRNRMHELEAIIDGHPNKSQSSENKDLKGLWNGGGGASLAIYGNVLITDHIIIWGGSESATKIYCKTTYTIEKEPPEASFEDIMGKVYTPNEKSQLKTYKLKLNPRKCTGSTTHLRLTLHQNLPEYAEFLEYENNHIIGYLGLHKKS
jgi:uncharacterized protein